MLYDTGTRREEVVRLQWPRVDLRAGVVRLIPQDVKDAGHRVVPLSARVLEALRAQSRRLHCPWVFHNPKTGKPYSGVLKGWDGARRRAGLEGLRLHDPRRTFATTARREGIPESVVMRYTGHKTHEVFRRYNIVEESDLFEARDRLELTRCNGEDLERATRSATPKAKRPSA